MQTPFVRLGAALGFVGVALGAFGAHALRPILGDLAPVWETGVTYQLVHALALIMVGILFERSSSQRLQRVGWLFFAGVLLFSGSLYVLALTKIKILGAITPLGGLAFLIGWLLLAWKQEN